MCASFWVLDPGRIHTHNSQAVVLLTVQVALRIGGQVWRDSGNEAREQRGCQRRVIKEERTGVPSSGPTAVPARVPCRLSRRFVSPSSVLYHPFVNHVETFTWRLNVVTHSRITLRTFRRDVCWNPSAGRLASCAMLCVGRLEPASGPTAVPARGPCRLSRFFVSPSRVLYDPFVNHVETSTWRLECR